MTAFRRFWASSNDCPSTARSRSKQYACQLWPCPTAKQCMVRCMRGSLPRYPVPLSFERHQGLYMLLWIMGATTCSVTPLGTICAQAIEFNYKFISAWMMAPYKLVGDPAAAQRLDPP